MDVILKDYVAHLGEPGDIVAVKPGYARNYLLPRGLAYAATDANRALAQDERRKAEERAKRDFLEAKRRASQLEGVDLVFQAKAGEEGKLFGSVTTSDIADRLAEQELDFEVDRRRLVLANDPIKELGVHTATLRLHPEVEVELEITVEAEEE